MNTWLLPDGINESLPNEAERLKTPKFSPYDCNYLGIRKFLP